MIDAAPRIADQDPPLRVNRLPFHLIANIMRLTMRPWHKIASLLVAIIAGIQVSIAEDTSKPEGFIGVVRDVELGQHEKLIKAQSAPGAVLAPFTTDGCSGGMSATWALAAGIIASMSKKHGARPPWEDCCVAHDRIYHAGAPAGADAEASFQARLAADEALGQCVRDVGVQRAPALAVDYGVSEDDVRRIYDGLGGGIVHAVRLGGAPCTGLSWRWGYGWPQCNVLTD